MPKVTQSFRVFLASPSDVAADRESVAQAIEELNGLVEARGFRFDLVRWEKDSSPAVASEYAQQVLNDQLLSEIDIMIAVFGSRLGTPTPNAPSGTAEEVRSMLVENSHPMRENRLMVLFKRMKVDALDCDLDQLRALREFRTELQSSAVFYKEYETQEELKETVRRSLVRAAETQPVSNHSANSSLKYSQTVEIDELGLLDHQQLYESGLREVNGHLANGAKLMFDFAEQTSINTEKFESAKSIGDLSPTN